MTENGDPYENALAERMNRTLRDKSVENYYWPAGSNLCLIIPPPLPVK